MPYLKYFMIGLPIGFGYYAYHNNLIRLEHIKQKYYDMKLKFRNTADQSKEKLNHSIHKAKQQYENIQNKEVWEEKLRILEQKSEKGIKLLKEKKEQLQDEEYWERNKRNAQRVIENQSEHFRNKLEDMKEKLQDKDNWEQKINVAQEQLEKTQEKLKQKLENIKKKLSDSDK